MTHRRTYLLLPMAIVCLSLPARAQSYPENVVCNVIENYGALSEHRIEHPHQIVLNFSAETDTGFSYNAYATNWHDDGGGENVAALYSKNTGALINSSSGISCPPTLAP